MDVEKDPEHFSSDDEVNPEAHKKLLNAVSRIGKNQYIKKPTRSEPALVHDEFHLAKSVAENVPFAPETAVSISDLVKVLTNTSKHVEIGKELRNTRRNKKLLPKPLEKPVAERIQRQIGYEDLKKNLSKWDAVVERNRVAEQQVFPLQYEEIKVDVKKNVKFRDIRIKSDLRKDFEEIEAEYKPKAEDVSAVDDENAVLEKLTKEEVIARRKKIAYLRMRESMKSAKARLRNKIKSKKYHKLLKRQKIKEQMAEFEKLQKINPEAALEKLQQIEKTRVAERASLRHKNTGTWAKNLKVRAQYDKEVQKDLAEQLALSRELTAKLKQDEDDESANENDEQEVEDDGDDDPFNPWMKAKKKKNEVDKFFAGYRKYWLERNKNEKALEEFRENGDDVKEETNGEDSEMLEGSSLDANKGPKIAESEENNGEDSENYIKEEIVSDDSDDVKNSNTENESVKKRMKRDQNKSKDDKISTTLKKKTSKIKKTGKKPPKHENGWLVEENSSTNQLSSDNEAVASLKDIDDIFDEAEDKIQEKVQKKLEKLTKSLKNQRGKKDRKSKSKSKEDHLSLAFKKKSSRPEMDEELLETPAKEKEHTTSTADVVKEIQKAVDSKTGQEIAEGDQQVIDPTNFVTIKAKTFKSELADIINSGDFVDEDEDDTAVNGQMSLSAAFEDDDLEADFQKERDEERKKNSVEEVDLTVPGWGSWGGCGVRPKKRHRLVLKFPEPEKRRDDNKEKVYINENDNKKLKQHLVSDLPFPFTSVKDYEASIRAPIGPDFVPETAFRVMTRPAIIAKMGQIIEPMKENDLLKPPKRPRTAVDRKIELLNETSNKK